MITEDYVSYETAKLLKEKGFVCKKESITAMYGEDGEFYSLSTADPYHFNWGDFDENDYIAPTLQSAMKWLREIQGLSIYFRAVWKDAEVQYGDWESAVVGYDWFVESLLDNTYSKMSIEPFLTYKEACEAAIKYCLENLI